MPNLLPMTTKQLASLYYANSGHRPLAEQILAELERRELRRIAARQPLLDEPTRLKATIRDDLRLSSQVVVTGADISHPPAKRWLPWFVGFALLAITQGVFQAMGYHIWEPILMGIKKQWGA
jgi:hypothetical protein